MKTFEGVVVALATPFTDKDSVDESALRSLIRFVLKEGHVHGLLASGGTGEFVCLSETERKRVVEVTVDEVDGQVPVLAGAAAISTTDTIKYCQHAQRVGADGLLVMPPYSCLPSEDELYEHYRVVADSVSIPIMLYNHPDGCGVDLLPGLVARLVEIPNIVYIKDTSGDIRRVTEITRLCGDKIGIFIGWESLGLPALALGARGWVCGVSNIIPKQAVRLYELLAVEQNLPEARRLNRQMLPLFHVLESEGKFIPYIKAGLELRGVPVGPPRRPLLPVSEDERLRLKTVLNRALEHSG